ncbi:hypothetical protein D3Z45_21495 [Lachnospiraceae bacterium]|nr:hypothetical protein [Lachnospiraceae bacterium]
MWPLEKGLQSHRAFTSSLETDFPPLLRDMSPGEASLFQELLEQESKNSMRFCHELHKKRRGEKVK